VLVTAGVFRPQIPELVRQHWTLVVLSAAVTAAVALAAAAKLAPGPDPYRRALTALFPLALAAMYIQPQRVASDGVFYFAPLHSLIVDGDLDFRNEYRVLRVPEGYFHPTPTGRLPNNFSVGPALVWAPFYLLVHGLARLGLFRATGFGYPYFTAVATATALVGFLGVVWFYRLARSYFDPPVALTSAVALWLGSFHLWYMVFEPSMSHALAMSAVAAFLLLTHRGLEGSRAFVLAGAAAGVVVLLRWQNVVFLPVALATSWPKRSRWRWWEPVLGIAVAVIVFLPQAIYWKLIYGHFFLVPQGGSYLEWSSPQFEAVLFSSRHGLLSWSPLLWVGAIGFIGLVKRAPALGGSLAIACAAALFVNASVRDWWAGASFGARRFDGALPALGLGIAVAVEWGLPWIRRHALVVAALLLSPFLVWSMMLMAIYASGAVPVDGALSFRQAGADALEIVYRLTGYPPSWPGALAEKVRTGLPPAAYDLAGAHHLSNNVDIRMGDTDGLHLGRGWSLPHRRRGATFREGSPGGAFLYVALRQPAPYRLRIEGRSEGEIVIRWNRGHVGRIALLGGGEASLPVPSRLVRSGVNELEFSSAGRSGYAVSRVTLVRPGGEDAERSSH
jgi:hypothetical protein